MHNLNVYDVLEAYNIVGSLGQTISLFTAQQASGLQLPSQQFYEFEEKVRKLIDQLDGAELRVASINATRLFETLQTIDKTQQSAVLDKGAMAILHQKLVALNNVLRDEFISRKVIVISLDAEKLYAPLTPVFGAEVETKFSGQSEDIGEAGKCIALGRYTASVFHLMRAMESALKVLGVNLNVTVVDKNNVDLEWGKILSNMSAPIEAMPKGNEKEDWSAAFALLVHVKQAWRNPTMHPKQTYTEEQAKEIFAATRSFMNSLADLV
jgi:hypothetical protein